MSWLSNHSLERLVHRFASERTRQAFYGAVAIDQLPAIVDERPWIAIVNTQESHLPGAHWLCLFIDSDGSGEVFNSTGRPPPPKVSLWMNKQCRHKWKYNTLTYQTPGTSTCGAFVLYVVLHRLCQRTLTDTLRVFSSNTLSNDVYVTDFFHMLSNRQ